MSTDTSPRTLRREHSRELRSCARHGHTTYAPTEPDLRAALSTTTALGEAWRCLRCGDYVLGPAQAEGPADDAPVPLRGKALRQGVVLRLLGAERAVRGVVLLAAAYGIWRFSSAQKSLQSAFDRFLPQARPLAHYLGVDVDNSVIVRDLTKAFSANHSTLLLVALAVAVYALLELVEGVGLWLYRRWAEYLTVIATAAFLPLEVHELLKGVTVLRGSAFVINVAAVVYLVLAKRLFGARGGRRAYEAEMGSASLLEVTAAATGSSHSQGGDVGMGPAH